MKKNIILLILFIILFIVSTIIDSYSFSNGSNKEDTSQLGKTIKDNATIEEVAGAKYMYSFDPLGSLEDIKIDKVLSS